MDVTRGGGLSPVEEVVERARQLAAVLEIPASTFAGHEYRAYHLMSHLLAVPTIRDLGQRNRYINELLQNVGRLFPPHISKSAQFIGVFGQKAAIMQTFPFWFTHLSMSNAQLVSDYRMTTNVLWGMGVVGITPLGIGAPGFLEAVKQYRNPGELRTRVLAATRGFAKGTMESVTGGIGRRLGMVWVIGAFVAEGMQDRQALLAAEVGRRFADGRLSPQELRQALGDGAALPYRYFHQVR